MELRCITRANSFLLKTVKCTIRSYNIIYLSKEDVYKLLCSQIKGCRCSLNSTLPCSVYLSHFKSLIFIICATFLASWRYVCWPPSACHVFSGSREDSLWNLVQGVRVDHFLLMSKISLKDYSLGVCKPSGSSWDLNQEPLEPLPGLFTTEPPSQAWSLSVNRIYYGANVRNWKPGCFCYKTLFCITLGGVIRNMLSGDSVALNAGLMLVRLTETGKTENVLVIGEILKEKLGKLSL